jgi:hypothetical protein
MQTNKPPKAVGNTPRRIANRMSHVEISLILNPYLNVTTALVVQYDSVLYLVLLIVHFETLAELFHCTGGGTYQLEDCSPEYKPSHDFRTK